MEQISMVLRSEDDGSFSLAFAVGEPGIDHARALNGSFRSIDTNAAENVVGALADVVGPANAEADALSAFIDGTPTTQEG